MRCSRTRAPALFDAMLGGHGQCAIIARAVVGLQPAAAAVRLFDLLYVDLATFAADARMVVRDGRFATVQGLVVPSAAGGWAYLLEATSSSAQSNDELLGGLRDVRGEAAISELSYAAYAKRLDPNVEQQRCTGEWELPHPWLNVWLPDRHAEAFAGTVLSGLTLRDTGGGPILLYPTRSAPFEQPLLRVPASELIWQFSILRTALPTASAAQQMVKDNRRLLQRARRVGGYDYPVGATPVTRRDWEQHFGAQWPRFARAKRHYDPAGILTPGPGIFARRRSAGDHAAARLCTTRRAVDRPRCPVAVALAVDSLPNGAAARLRFTHWREAGPALRVDARTSCQRITVSVPFIPWCSVHT